MALEKPNLVAEALARLGLEPRLTDSRLTREHDDGAATVDELDEHPLEHGELRLATDERRRHGLLRRRLTLPADLVRGGRRAPTLQLELAQRLQDEAFAQLTGRLGAHDQLSVSL
jgi:hypothetical protein